LLPSFVFTRRIPTKRLFLKLRSRDCLLAAFMALLASVALAQNSATRTEQYEKSFADMYADVGNLDKTFAFAEAAIAVGDIEGAVAALERMLIIEPDLPQIRLQLGTLYFQLGSFAMASTYLDAVLQAQDVPDEAKALATSILKQIDQMVSPHRFSGSVSSGVRYQSNANGGPLTPDIRLFGGSALLDEEYLGQPDWDLSLTGQFSYVYDFDTEPAFTIESNLLALQTKQNTFSQIDTSTFEIQLGPRVVLNPKSGTAADLRPYLLVNSMAMGGKDSFDAMGGGLDFDWRASRSMTWRLGARLADRDYKQATEKGLDGDRLRAFGGASLALTDTTLGSLTLSSLRENAQDKAFAYSELGVQADVQRIFGNFLNPQFPGSTLLSIGFFSKAFDEASPTIDPNVVREDQTLRLNGAVTLPLNTNFSFLITAGYTDVNSNLPNFTNENWFSSLSVLVQF